MSTKRAEVFTSNRGVFTGGVYLLGGTNGEKSSLFNSLINSVLCHINVLECIQHAIVLNLPHTTMNILRFPIQLKTEKIQLKMEQLFWVSVQCSPDQYVVFNVMTPPGLGIHLRQPSLLKYLFHLHGSHIEQTSFFNNHIY
ncbi:unnamed protein product [Rotaria sordida]|uniref:Uncharacterized protein n=1 Tax=Rotaria sordida TaxID=392033 RepID=A0A815UXV1_9BILA|nr:unnamed protein product [Rotaria sordida]